MAETLRFAVLIPALNPDRILLGLLAELRRAGVPRVVVVDDGSSGHSAEIFAAVAGMDSVTLLRHERNVGKGAAIRTALTHVRSRSPELLGAVVMDADGQHTVADALRVGSVLEEGAGALVLGVRGFEGDVPFRSRLGNAISAGLFGLLTGLKLSDVQTGLRGIPEDLAPQFLALRGERYEFETEMLMLCGARRIPVREVPIETIYSDGNVSSHFRPLRDSLRVLRCLLGFRAGAGFES